MTLRALRFIFGMLCGILISAATQASSPAEKIICTQEPRSRWLPVTKIREIFGESDFTLSKLKVSRGNCYEFYAVSHDGSVIEAYYHPISGKVVRYNRVTARSSESLVAPAASR